MSSVAKTFTIAAVSNVLPLLPGQSATYTAIVDALETFTGWAVLQRSRSAQQAWETILTLDGRTNAIAPGTTSGTVVNETTAVEYYRWQNFTASGAEEMDVTIADVVDVDVAPFWQGGVLRTSKGVEVLRVNDDGSVTIATATITTGAITNLGALLEAAIGALPTSEPVAVGALWLNSGVLTVGNGP